MKFSTIKSLTFSLFLFLGASIAGAATLTVGPTGQYATPCPAIMAAAPGDTITIDYNSGIPYQEPPDPTHNGRSDCVWYTNNLTIVGINGRPILDAAGEDIEKGILDARGAGAVISNLELRHASTIPGQGDNAAGIRVDSEPVSTPGGGDITVQFCYIHDNEDGVLTGNVGPGSGGAGYPDQKYLSANPYITLQYDEFSHNGIDGSGLTHNMYVGFDTYETTTFTLQYSWSHDAYIGHTVKSRNAINNIYYNLITDQLGGTSYILDFPLGGSTYVVGNLLFKGKHVQYYANQAFMIFADYFDNTASDPEYSAPHQDLHFVNNTVVLDPATFTSSYVQLVCQQNTDVTTCPPAKDGSSLATNAVVENNIFVGPALGPGAKPELVTNQLTAVASHNLQVTNTPANLAALFADPANYDYHLVSGAAAIGAGLYPPTDNTGAADPKALAAYEYVNPSAAVARPVPSGSTMDEGAFSYPRVAVPVTPGLTYTTSVTTPGTGTITLTGLPTPPAGQYNQAAFISENQAVIGTISSASSTTGTLSTIFTATAPLTGTTVVPIDIYVGDAHLVANVTVVPGAIVLQSLTLDRAYYPETTVHLTNPPTTASGPIAVDLTTTDSSILYAPASVLVPVGALTAETGSETGSLWGQTPKSQTATLSAIYGGDTKALPVNVYAPYISRYYCNTYPCAVVGGNTVNIAATIAGEFPPSGASVVFTSDNPAVIPNQTISAPAGKFNGANVATNAVTTTTSVGITASVNGSSYGGVHVTVTPASGTNVVPNTSASQTAQVGTNFPAPLVAKVTNAGKAVVGVTVTFTGNGISFPAGATAITDSTGLASVTAQPTAAGTVTASATVPDGNGPAIFYETGTGGGVTVVSGSGQTAGVGTNFTNPLVVLVKDASGNPQAGATVTFAGSGVSFPAGATAVTNASGQASVTAQPTATGPLTVTASVTAGGATSATFSETGTLVPKSIAAVSGSGQSAPVGTSFANPLVALVLDASGNPVAATTVTFAGSNVTFPAGATVATNSSGQAQVTAQPTATGSIAITASVTGVSTPASFSESATPQVILTSVTVDGSGPGTTVHISTPATTPVVIQLSSSDPTVLFTPATVTIPVGASSAETGTLLGSVWTPATAKTAVLTAIYSGVTKTASVTLTPPTIEFFKCSPASCKDVVGGNAYTFMLKVDGVAPAGGGVVQIVSDNPAAFPNQTIPIPQGQTIPPPYKLSLNTNAVTATATVNVTATYGSVVTAGPISVTPPGVPASIAVVSGSGQTVAVNTNPFANPLVVLVEDAQGNPVLPGTTVTFAGTGVSFPSGATAVTDSAGHAQVTAQPTTTGTLTITATVPKLNTTASFSETGAPPPASVAGVSGSGQTAAVGTTFANPLIAVVKDASGSPVAGATVTFAGTGVTFPAGATATTNSSGQAQVTAQPGQNSLGALTITATVPGVGAPVTFSETGTAGAAASVAAVSGAGQSTIAGTSFTSPLVVLVKDTYGNAVAGATVTFAGTNVSFPSGATAVSNDSGQAQVTAEPTLAGARTITASVAGVSVPAVFSETATVGAPASVLTVSGSGQTAPQGISFASPLVVLVKDAYNNPVPGATVTFAGTNLTFTSSATTVTDNNGNAQVTAQPTAIASIAVTASVAGVSMPASFSETGTAPVVTSVTLDQQGYPRTTVHLSAAAPAGGAVVSLISSDPTALYAPATVTVPAGLTAAEDGTLIGSLWGQSPGTKTATLTAIYNGVTATLTNAWHTPGINSVACGGNPCNVKGGNSFNMSLGLNFGGAPYGGGPVTFTSSNTAVIPNQSFNMASGQANANFLLTTNAVTTATTVTVTANFNGAVYGRAVQVNP